MLLLIAEIRSRKHPSGKINGVSTNFQTTGLLKWLFKTRPNVFYSRSNYWYKAFEKNNYKILSSYFTRCSSVNVYICLCVCPLFVFFLKVNAPDISPLNKLQRNINHVSISPRIFKFFNRFWHSTHGQTLRNFAAWLIPPIKVFGAWICYELFNNIMMNCIQTLLCYFCNKQKSGGRCSTTEINAYYLMWDFGEFEILPKSSHFLSLVD